MPLKGAHSIVKILRFSDELSGCYFVLKCIFDQKHLLKNIFSDSLLTPKHGGKLTKTSSNSKRWRIAAQLNRPESL
ncbi:hypothetical protein ACMYSO_01760 [Klebsiella sp. B345]|uniref:hypothetical protein n=1 Tax=Klebsiella sp. B345 TaxID=2755398 RepID=UPI003DAA2E98